MDLSDLSGLSALAIATIGGLTSRATTWITQHVQRRHQRQADRVARGERLYGIPIDEASTRDTDALTHSQSDPAKFVARDATAGKLRLFAPSDVVAVADAVIKEISDIYDRPNRDFTRHETAPNTQPTTLRVFSEVCRNALRPLCYGPIGTFAPTSLSSRWNSGEA